jgi:hypothetical protein
LIYPLAAEKLRRGTRRSVGTAMLEVHALMEPEKRHVLELREDEQRAEDEDKAGGRPAGLPRPRR